MPLIFRRFVIASSSSSSWVETDVVTNSPPAPKGEPSKFLELRDFLMPELFAVKGEEGEGEGEDEEAERNGFVEGGRMSITGS